MTLKTHVHIISGFLGAGKTTFLRKVLPTISGVVALVENELGSVGVDGDLFAPTLVKKEIYAGCICCSIARDFQKAIEELVYTLKPDHIFIEPSGAAGLTEVLRTLTVLEKKGLPIALGAVVTLVDILNFEDYQESFGLFYEDQIRHAGLMLMSFMETATTEQRERGIEGLQKLNPRGILFQEDWRHCPGEVLGALMETSINSREDIEIDPFTTIRPPALNAFSFPCPQGLTALSVDLFLEGIGQESHGRIYRAKGLVPLSSGDVIHFDWTPTHRQWQKNVLSENAGIVVIGRDLNREAIEGFLKDEGSWKI